MKNGFYRLLEVGETIRVGEDEYYNSNLASWRKTVKGIWLIVCNDQVIRRWIAL